MPTSSALPQVVSISNDKKQLQDLEDKILRLLREATGNILDDEVLINTLNNSKTTSGQLGGKGGNASGEVGCEQTSSGLILIS